MNNNRILISYYNELPRLYIYFGFISLIIGSLEIVGVTSLMPIVGLILGESDSEISGPLGALFNLTKDLDIIYLVMIFCSFLFFQTLLSIYNESNFIFKMAKWRTDQSIKYVNNIEKTLYLKK